MSVEVVPTGPELDYVAVCSCGWQSLQMDNLKQARAVRCAVMDAELEGAKRRARRLEPARSA